MSYLSQYGLCPAGSLPSPRKVDVLSGLVWLMPSWFITSPGKVDVLSGPV